MEEVRALGRLIDKDGNVPIVQVSNMLLDIADRIHEAQSGAVAVSLANMLRDEAAPLAKLAEAVTAPTDAAIDPGPPVEGVVKKPKAK